MSFGLAFDCHLSVDTMLPQLRALTPWNWRISDSDNYGRLLWAIPGAMAKLSILRDEGHWLLEASASTPTETLSEPLLREEFIQRILPALGATNVREARTIR